jgi:hypothetical protein
VLPSVVRSWRGPHFATRHRYPKPTHMDPMIPNDDVEVLAQDMIKHFPADAADQAALRSSAFFAMGYVEKSKKWMLVRATIKKILTDADSEPRSIAIGANQSKFLAGC